MPFSLKNVGTTYQRLMDRILKPLPRQKVQAYVDDMVVTSPEAKTHSTDLAELFATINGYGLKLNPDKCVFRVKAGKFLGFLLTERRNWGQSWQVRNNLEHAESEQCQRGTTTDRTYGCLVQILIEGRGQRTPILRVSPKEEEFSMVRWLRINFLTTEGTSLEPSDVIPTSTRSTFEIVRDGHK